MRLHQFTGLAPTEQHSTNQFENKLHVFDRNAMRIELRTSWPIGLLHDTLRRSKRMAFSISFERLYESLRKIMPHRVT